MPHTSDGGDDDACRAQRDQAPIGVAHPPEQGGSQHPSRALRRLRPRREAREPGAARARRGAGGTGSASRRTRRGTAPRCRAAAPAERTRSRPPRNRPRRHVRNRSAGSRRTPIGVAQRLARGVPPRHSGHARPGRCRRRREVDAAHRRAPRRRRQDRAADRLRERERTAQDVAADVGRVECHALGRRHRVRREDAIAEAGCEPLHLTGDELGRVEASSRPARGCTPTAPACPPERASDRAPTAARRARRAAR